MAANFCKRFLNIKSLVNVNRNFKNVQRNYSYKNNTTHQSPKTYGKYLWIIGGGATAIICINLFKSRTNSVKAFNMRHSKYDEDSAISKLTARERRFIKFASSEYDGQLYMTPQDFLESVVEQEPRPRLKRRILTERDINSMRDETPALKKGSNQLFRKLRDRGIISYTEYLFLLSILTKPQSGFRIAFNMFDTDGNQRVDKNEFLVILKILGFSFRNHDMDDETRRVLKRLVSTEEQARELYYLKKKVKKENKNTIMERIFSGAWKDKHGKTNKNKEDEDDTNVSNKTPEEVKEEDNYIDDEEGLQRKHKVDTTLQIHLFGKKGNQDLHYEGFHKFMDNLQTEVLELEFSEFSKGSLIITELDFAKILLRYTYLDTDEYDKFLDRLLERIKHEQHGITFNEFCDFCHFLNNLDDFAIAMRMYTLAERAISKDEFSRAVKICTGRSLSMHLIDTVFAIFDADGDGFLFQNQRVGMPSSRASAKRCGK
uniref:EF-hand domain-containing protein n=1 Tax=Glossina austeni TaxID=7395 RepID=A0A1A9VAF0_GLOAU